MFRMKMDANWRRLILTCLSQDHRTWMDEELPARVITWDQFKTAFSKAFGVDKTVERGEAANELMKVQVARGESFDDYKKRFFELKSKASGSVAKELLAGLFVKGCPKEMQDTMDVVLISWKAKDHSNLQKTLIAVKKLAPAIGLRVSTLWSRVLAT